MQCLHKSKLEDLRYQSVSNFPTCQVEIFEKSEITPPPPPPPPSYYYDPESIGYMNLTKSM